MTDNTANNPIDLDDLSIEESINPIDLDAISIDRPNNYRRLRTGMMSGGGLIITIAAAVSLFVLLGVESDSSSTNDYDISVEDALGTQANDDETPVLSQGASIPLVVPLPPTTLPSLYPSISPSESNQPSALPSENPTTSFAPSITPSYNPSQSFEPTLSLLPTLSLVPSTSFKPTLSMSPSTMPSNTPTHKSTTQKPTFLNKFRLRLHWTPGYYWQENYDETWFCLACATCNHNLISSSCALEERCQEGMLLGLVDCEPGKGGKVKAVEFTIKRIFFDKIYRGDLISLYESDLCITRNRRDVYLEKCTGDIDQRWTGFNFEKEFELQPKGRKGAEKCLTQHHHPKRGERIFAENCSTARKTETSLWITY